MTKLNPRSLIYTLTTCYIMGPIENLFEFLTSWIDSTGVASDRPVVRAPITITYSCECFHLLEMSITCRNPGIEVEYDPTTDTIHFNVNIPKYLVYRNEPEELALKETLEKAKEPVRRQRLSTHRKSTLKPVTISKSLRGRHIRVRDYRRYNN